MSRWTRYLWQALAALGTTGYPYLYPCVARNGDTTPAREVPVDRTDDDAAVRAIFREMVEREWGSAALVTPAPSQRTDPPEAYPFWPGFLQW
jgi:hypothetical protein